MPVSVDLVLICFPHTVQSKTRHQAAEQRHLTRGQRLCVTLQRQIGHRYTTNHSRGQFPNLEVVSL